MLQNKIALKKYVEFRIITKIADEEKENLLRFITAAHGLSHRCFVSALRDVLLMHDSASISDSEDASCYFSATLRATQFPDDQFGL